MKLENIFRKIKKKCENEKLTKRSVYSNVCFHKIARNFYSLKILSTISIIEWIGYRYICLMQIYDRVKSIVID